MSAREKQAAANADMSVKQTLERISAGLRVGVYNKLKSERENRTVILSFLSQKISCNKI